MTTHTPDPRDAMNDPPDPQDLLSALNIVPDWARGAPATNPYANHSHTERRDAPRRSSPGARGRFGNDRGGDRANRDKRGRPPRPNGSGGEHRRDAAPPRGREESDHPLRAPADHRRAAAPERLPIQISFIPEQEKLTTVVGDIRTAQKAFPLPDLARLFLSKPEWHGVKLEANRQRGGTYALEFFLSRESGRVFMQREAAESDALHYALDHHFESETVQMDPPAGNFACVARCGLSGVLLGPPNHHGYNEMIEDIHRTRYPHMRIDDYRRHIETLRDPEAVESWKEAFRTRTVYRMKQAPAAPTTPPPVEVAADDTAPDEAKEDASAPAMMTEKEVRAYIVEHKLRHLVSTVHRAMLSGTTSRSLADPAMLHLVRTAWQREQRHPASLIRALRGAFRHMRLSLIKFPDTAEWVTPIAPHPMDAQGVAPGIRDLLEWLRAHPGSRRSELVEGLHPGVSTDPAALAELLQPLAWLIEKGHVIETHNGRLFMPPDQKTPEGDV